MRKNKSLGIAKIMALTLIVSLGAAVLLPGNVYGAEMAGETQADEAICEDVEETDYVIVDNDEARGEVEDNKADNGLQVPDYNEEEEPLDGISSFVNRCYEVSFGRKPDQGGFDYWKGRIENGELDGSMVVYNFIFSKEYMALGTGDAQFVNDLYTMFMGREADDDGFNYWYSELRNGKTRKNVFAGFANSDEFYNLCKDYGITAGYFSEAYNLDNLNKVNLFVERLYKTCLNRIGDKKGQIYWTEGLLNGTIGGITCAANFIKSEEYLSKALSNESYIKNLYLAFMGREYDYAGLVYWQRQMYDGKNRDRIFLEFANTTEFENICGGYGIEKGIYPPKQPVRVELDGMYRIDEYNVNGRLTKQSFYSNYNTLKYWYMVDYDQQGNKVGYTQYNSLGIVGIKRVNYDAAGREVKVVSYDPFANLEGWVENAYYDNGVLKQEVSYLADGTVESVFEYDENGILRREVLYFKGGSTYVNEYNPNKTISRKIYCGTDGSVYVSEYDANGKITRKTETESNGSVYAEEYDANGNITKKSQKNADGTLLINLFNSNGTLIRVEEHRKDGSYGINNFDSAGKLTDIINYDSKGNLKAHIGISGYKTSSEKWTYYTDSNMVVYIQRDSSGELSKGTTYDNKGNLRAVFTYCGNENVKRMINSVPSAFFWDFLV
ncbi:MAG: DUF4214 domain-containing protein, partial [Lachnospiraceae bacterium]|nr:DUF4214 domain-containing protein [Lachnospiraceae bacterium]